MADDRPTVGFFGDLDDPWVASIAEALPHLDERVHRPEALPDELPVCGLAVVHRAILGPSDADRLIDWRRAGIRVILWSALRFVPAISNARPNPPTCC